MLQPAAATRPQSRGPIDLHGMLYITPVMPSPTGKGVRMRAYSVLEAFARRHSVTCLVVPLWDPRGEHDVPRSTAELAEVVVASPGPAYALHRRLLSLAWYRRIVATMLLRSGDSTLENVVVPRNIGLTGLGGRRFDRVHAFRLCAAPFSSPFIDEAEFFSIDVDDLEGETKRRIARLPDTPQAMARALEAEARVADLALEHWRRRADVLLVASERDRETLSCRGGATPIVAPNVVRAPETAPALPTRPPHSILFVGGLDYAPNRDAVAWLSQEIVPALHRVETPPWKLLIVGAGGPTLLARLGARDPRIVAYDAVPDVAPLLARARAVVVPLRAGGGTRIKILEALAHARPVVATSLGAEGLDLERGAHLLVGDSTSEIVEHLARLLCDDQLAARLGTAGRARVLDAYSPSALAEALAGI